MHSRGVYIRAYRLRTDKLVPPFNEHPRDLLILNEKLSSIQDRVCRNLGIQLETVEDRSDIGDEERLVFYDHTYFTEDLMEEFVEKARKIGKAAACCLRRGAFTRRSITSTMSVSEEAGVIRYRMSYWPEGEESDSLAPCSDRSRRDSGKHKIPGPHGSGVRVRNPAFNEENRSD